MGVSVSFPCTVLFLMIKDCDGLKLVHVFNAVSISGLQPNDEGQSHPCGEYTLFFKIMNNEIDDHDDDSDEEEDESCPCVYTLARPPLL